MPPHYIRTLQDGFLHIITVISIVYASYELDYSYEFSVVEVGCTHFG